MSEKIAAPIISEIKDNRDELNNLKEELLSTTDERAVI